MDASAAKLQDKYLKRRLARTIPRQRRRPSLHEKSRDLDVPRECRKVQGSCPVPLLQVDGASLVEDYARHLDVA